MKAYLDGMAYMKAKPDEAAKIIGKFMGVSAKEAKEQMSGVYNIPLAEMPKAFVKAKETTSYYASGEIIGQLLVAKARSRPPRPPKPPSTPRSSRRWPSKSRSEISAARADGTGVRSAGHPAFSAWSSRHETSPFPPRRRRLAQHRRADLHRARLAARHRPDGPEPLGAQRAGCAAGCAHAHLVGLLHPRVRAPRHLPHAAGQRALGPVHELDQRQRLRQLRRSAPQTHAPPRRTRRRHHLRPAGFPARPPTGAADGAGARMAAHPRGGVRHARLRDRAALPG
ncbi:hypothetical protein Y695_02131 [Hydrogenophaga sp. T4]|nr:hypothetical protein Y695_02131 [Hydrogenophaga sp. T4]